MLSLIFWKQFSLLICGIFTFLNYFRTCITVVFLISVASFNEAVRFYPTLWTTNFVLQLYRIFLGRCSSAIFQIGLSSQDHGVFSDWSDFVPGNLSFVIITLSGDGTNYASSHTTNSPHLCWEFRRIPLSSDGFHLMKFKIVPRVQIFNRYKYARMRISFHLSSTGIESS